MNASNKLPSSAKALINAKLIDDALAREIISLEADVSSFSFLDRLISKNVSPADIARSFSESLGFPSLDLNAFADRPVGHQHFMDLLKNGILLLCDRQNALFVAVSDPTNEALISKMRHLTGRTLRPVMVEHDKLRSMLIKVSEEMGVTATTFGGGDALELSATDLNSLTTADQDDDDIKVGDSPIVKFLQKVILEAVTMGASDIHFEPYEKFYRVRFRSDGVLREFIQPPVVYKNRLSSRIKVMAMLDISEKRLPQDGRMRIRFSDAKVVDFRVSTVPTVYGEKIVIRVLDGSSANIGIDALGYSAEQKKLLLDAIARPYGMILVTGPTGSGKTVSLYNCLNLLNKPGINISTAEDPAEIQLPGINQVNVNDKIGLTFASVLRAFLRQDPDVIMVGEIRDLETADISVKAAQTGHLVLSTLHTNDAPKTLARLANMGVPAFNISSSVILITAQRLGRKLCSKCKQPADYTDEVLIEVGFKPEQVKNRTWVPYKASGCSSCGHSGYRGRVGFYQVMPITEAIQKLILSHATEMEIAQQAEQEGVLTMRQSGLTKVIEGATSIEEVVSVTNE